VHDILYRLLADAHILASTCCLTTSCAAAHAAAVLLDMSMVVSTAESGTHVQQLLKLCSCQFHECINLPYYSTSGIEAQMTAPPPPKNKLLTHMQQRLKTGPSAAAAAAMLLYKALWKLSGQKLTCSSSSIFAAASLITASTSSCGA
jgi:hypothetical protein